MKRRSIIILVSAGLLVIAGAVVIVFFNAASFLRVNAPEHADVMVVLGGGMDDSRYWRAVELMRAGYADRLVLDAPSFGVQFGKSGAQLAQDFLIRTHARNTTVCPVHHDSTYEEAEDVARCLAPLKVSSVLLVTSDYHTRRAFSIFTTRLPRYHWSIAACYAPFEPGAPQRMAGDDWWKNRRWAKTVVDEWQKLIWWNLVDRWKSDVVLQS